MGLNNYFCNWDGGDCCTEEGDNCVYPVFWRTGHCVGDERAESNRIELLPTEDAPFTRQGCLQMCVRMIMDTEHVATGCEFEQDAGGSTCWAHTGFVRPSGFPAPDFGAHTGFVEAAVYKESLCTHFRVAACPVGEVLTQRTEGCACGSTYGPTCWRDETCNANGSCRECTGGEEDSDCTCGEQVCSEARNQVCDWAGKKCITKCETFLDKGMCRGQKVLVGGRRLQRCVWDNVATQCVRTPRCPDYSRDGTCDCGKNFEGGPLYCVSGQECTWKEKRGSTEINRGDARNYFGECVEGKISTP